jgi:predicted nucleotide-binding protein (sugar kinase/HSP70/actin superfamily)
LDCASHLITPTLICESIIITGTTISELIEEVDGVISIQPFGCMPGRIGEAIINQKLSKEKLIHAKNKELVKTVMEQFPHLPYLTLEVDGQVFSQGTQAKLETFCLQVERLHTRTKEVREQLIKRTKYYNNNIKPIKKYVD